jgi:hypothetical protein
MGERTAQQRLVGEPVADAFGQRGELAARSGIGHVTVFYFTRSWT